LSDDYAVDVGIKKLRAGQKVVRRVAIKCGSGLATGRDHKELREALKELRSATNWLEDSELFEAAHIALDAAGKLAREYFPRGCLFPFRDGSYYIECPVALAHNRVGMSPGMVIKSAECSICGSDPEDCTHITGRLYDGKRCILIIKEADILEISFVGRPSQPDARIESRTVGIEEFRNQLGPLPHFTPGVPITCDRCLSLCDGVARPFEELDLDV
jgi:hypothetical protein